MTLIPVEIALVDNADIGASTIAQVAGALNQQVADFQRSWGVHYHASVVPHPAPTPNTWSVILQKGIDQEGALGYHSDNHNQPFAVVDVTRGEWTVTASHEVLEMIGDPFGNAMHSGPAPAGWHGPARVKYLREACDPCEAFSYEIGGVAVSDFLTLDWYGSRDIGRHGFSFLGKLTKPTEVAEGGYVSFVDPGTGIWWQRFVDGGQFHDASLGLYARHEFGSLREFTDGMARQYRAE